MCLPYWFCATVPFSYIPAAVLSLWQAKFQDQNKSQNCPEVQNIKKDIHDKTDPIGAPECGYDDCGVDQHGDQEFLLGGLRACFTWTQIDVQNDQNIQGQINAPVPDMAVGNYCAKLADDKKEQKKIFEIVFWEHLSCHTKTPPSYRSIYYTGGGSWKGRKNPEIFVKRFFGSLDRFSCLLQFIHWNGPGEPIDGVSGGPEDGAVQSLGDSGGLLAVGEELLHLSTPKHEQFYRRYRAWKTK